MVLALGVGGLHLVTGPGYRGPLRPFVTGYLIDILLPLVVFLLLTLPGLPILRRRWLVWLGVFGLGAAIETLQAFGVALFGRTFDPVDYLMYALGASLGLVVDRLVVRLEPARES